MTPTTALAPRDQFADRAVTAQDTADSDPTNSRTTVLRCSSTADFLAALPFLTGFTAENSLFLVLFRGKRSTSTVRIDLPNEGDAGAILPLIDDVCRLLEESGAGVEGPAIVITSRRSFAESQGGPWRRFARLLRRRFEREGWPIRDLAVVASDGWAGLLGPDRSRHSLDEISANPLVTTAAEAVSAVGTELPVPLEEFGGLPEPRPEFAASVISRLAELDRREEHREPADPSILLHGIARVAGACFGSEDELPEARLCARLIRSAEHPQHWLITALTAITRTEFVIELIEESPSAHFTQVPVESIHQEGTRSPSWSIRLILDSLSADTPDPAKLRRVIQTVAGIATHAPAARRPGLLALLAWAWWMRGMQSVAIRLVGEALALDPEHQISRMVERLVDSPPAWYFGAAFPHPHTKVQR